MPSIVVYQASHFDGIRLLWQQAFPSNAPKDAAELSFPANLSMQPDLFLVAIDRDMVVGSAVASIIAGYDGHRGWLYAVAVLQSHTKGRASPRLSSGKLKIASLRWGARRSICTYDNRTSQ